MSVQEVVQRYFAAMRRGATAEDELMTLFHADAEYSEPFTTEGPAVGIAVIRARFRHGWERPLPDMEIEVLSVDVDGSIAHSRWECRSPALPGPIRGEDRYEIRDGRIVKLEVTITDPGAS